ncbi:hypothetical protein ED733_002123 [Metarhizium rileyi]|uniref:NAD dependent epimerase/dehydratase n=1 Tax=Metarhizium rileyi (strain RCEF 4871) TaxID=1649241 RepID=A0A5C6G3R2_METRR|nr:hypothetical protein ED733_002123 [Metarhizium rileyi]
MSLPSSNTRMKVLSLGLPRTGSASIAKALKILGYESVCHGVDIIDTAPEVLRLFGRAADASFPVLPSYTGKPFAVKDWEELYWKYDASTDVAGLFGPHVLKCYPNAKVILVIRPFEQWFESLDDGVLKYVFGRPADLYCTFLGPLFGSEYLHHVRKIILGMFNARTLEEIRANARSVYDLHHSQIREMTPPSELLLLDLNQGWGPLCKFLGKPVPAVPFPRVNERAAIQAKMAEIIQRDVKQAAVKSLPWLAAVAVTGMAMYLKLTTYSKMTFWESLHNVVLHFTPSGFFPVGGGIPTFF